MQKSKNFKENRIVQNKRLGGDDQLYHGKVNTMKAKQSQRLQVQFNFYYFNY